MYFKQMRQIWGTWRHVGAKRIDLDKGFGRRARSESSCSWKGHLIRCRLFSSQGSFYLSPRIKSFVFRNFEYTIEIWKDQHLTSARYAMSFASEIAQLGPGIYRLYIWKPCFGNIWNSFSIQRGWSNSFRLDEVDLIVAAKIIRFGTLVASRPLNRVCLSVQSPCGSYPKPLEATHGRFGPLNPRLPCSC